MEARRFATIHLGLDPGLCDVKTIYKLYNFITRLIYTRLEAPSRVPLPSLLKIQLLYISLDDTSIEYVIFKKVISYETEVERYTRRRNTEKYNID